VLEKSCRRRIARPSLYYVIHNIVADARRVNDLIHSLPVLLLLMMMMMMVLVLHHVQ